MVGDCKKGRAGIPGMMARYAQINAVGSGSALSTFEITPGYQTQRFDIGRNISFNLSNFYVHVDPGGRFGQQASGVNVEY